MGQQAELVFAGGAVYTADASRRRVVPAEAADGSPASSVAVVGGRIEAVGNAGDTRIQELIGPATEVVDLRGRALLPGFQDAHVHPAFAGVTMIGCNLMGAANLDDALARVAAYAEHHPEREWIAGSGWRMEWFPGGTPDRQTLDRVTGGRPAYLSNRDGHGAWANTRALELAGLDARTPDPADGRIERAADGSPQGTLHEGAASLVGDLVPDLSFDERLAGLLLAQQHMHARGITAGKTRSWGTTSAALTRCRCTWPPPPAASSPRGLKAHCGGTAAGMAASFRTSWPGGSAAAGRDSGPIR